MLFAGLYRREMFQKQQTSLKERAFLFFVLFFQDFYYFHWKTYAGKLFVIFVQLAGVLPSNIRPQ